MGRSGEIWGDLGRYGGITHLHREDDLKLCGHLLGCDGAVSLEGSFDGIAHGTGVDAARLGAPALLGEDALDRADHRLPRGRAKGGQMGRAYQGRRKGGIRRRSKGGVPREVQRRYTKEVQRKCMGEAQRKAYEGGA